MVFLALMTALAAGLMLRDPRHRRFEPGLLAGLVAFGCGGVLALVSALDAASALRYLALAVGPWLFFVVGRGAGPLAVDVWARGLIVAALVPLGVDLWSWWNGDWMGVNALPRLVGAYSDPHPHATALWVFGCASVWVGCRERGAWQWLAVGVGLVAVAALWLVWVRTVQAMVVVAALVGFAHQRRWRWVLGTCALVALALGLSSTLRERFSDLVMLGQAVGGESNLKTFGSNRGHIWMDVGQGMWESGPMGWFFGLGAGAERTLHRSLDPHSDVLSLWVQGGVCAATGWILAIGSAARGAGARDSWQRSVSVAVAASVLLAASVSNDVWSHLLLVWWTWAVWGALQQQPRTGSGSERDGEVVIEPA